MRLYTYLASRTQWQRAARQQIHSLWPEPSQQRSLYTSENSCVQIIDSFSMETLIPRWLPRQHHCLRPGQCLRDNVSCLLVDAPACIPSSGGSVELEWLSLELTPRIYPRPSHGRPKLRMLTATHMHRHPCLQASTTYLIFCCRSVGYVIRQHSI